MFEEALDQDQAAQEGQWGDTRDVAPPQTQPQAQGQPQDGQWGDTRGPEPTGANPVSVNPSAAALTQMERGPEVRMPQMPGSVNEAVKDTGDVLQRVAEGQGAGMAKDFADAIAGTDPGAGDRAKEHFSNFMLFLRNDPQRAWEELGKSGQSMVDVGKRIGEGDWRGAAGAASGAIYHGIAGIPLVGGQLKGIADENNAGHYKEGAADAFNFFTQFLHPETGEKQLVAAPEVGLKFGRDPKALEAQQYIMSKGAPANAAAATASPFVKAIQKGTEMTPLAAYTSESSHLKAMGVVGDIAEELKKRNAAGAQVPETAGAGAQAALEAKIGMAHDAANKEYGEFRRMQADPANVKNVQIGSQTIDTGLLDAQGNKITRVQPIMEKVGLPVDISPLMDKLRPLYDELREEMPISRQEASPGFTVLSNIVNSNKSVISAAKAESALGAIKSLTREASEGRGQGLAKYVTPQLEQLIDRAIDIPIDATGLKTGLQPVLQRLQQRMTPQQLLALPGIRDLSTFLKGPDQLRASQFKATLQNLNALAGEDAALPGVLQQAADDVRAKDPAGALERGRAATSAKYVTKDVLEQMRTEPVQAFNQLTYANDAGIDFLRQVNKEVPGQARNIGRAYMEKLFDQKPDKMFASWGNLGPSTKKILFDPGVANEMDKLVRAARDNAANPNPSGTAVVLGATAGLGGLILHPIAATPTIIGGAALSKLLRSQLGVRLLTEGITVPIHAPRAAVIINTLRRIAGTEIGPRAEKTAGNTDQTDWKYATGGKVHYDDGGDVQQDNYDPSQDPVLRKLEQERQAKLGFTPSTAVTGGTTVGTSPDPNAVAAMESGPNLLGTQPGPGMGPGVPTGYERPFGSEQTGLPGPPAPPKPPPTFETQLQQPQAKDDDLVGKYILDPMTSGAGTLMRGAEKFTTPDLSTKQAVGAATEVASGAMGVMTPFMLGAGLASPSALASTVQSLGGAAAVQAIVEDQMKQHGYAPEYVQGAGMAAGLAAGSAAHAALSYEGAPVKVGWGDVKEAGKAAFEGIPTQQAFEASEIAARARLRANGAFEGTFGTGAGGMGQNFQDVATLLGAQLGSGVYKVGAEAAARSRQIQALMQQWRDKEMTPEEQDALQKASDASPEIKEIAPFLTPLEARKMLASPKQVESMSRLLRVLPQSEKMAAMALGGADKVGWYRGSAQAIQDVFGADAPRFAQLLAALSPRISVEGNLTNALNVWKNWVKEGRPTNNADILRIMAKSVQGSGTEKSAMEAWRNNTYAALTSDDPMSLTLSGPKVDSFQHNLRDHVFQVTNDAWMANAYNVAQDMFSGAGKNLAAGNPGMTTEYAGASARLRAGAAQAGMFPSQGQEAIWSVAMQLYELAREHKIDPREVLQKGYLKPDVIRKTPDFSTLLRKPEYLKILDEAGYGDAARAMVPFVFDQAQKANMTPQQQQLLMEAAGTINETMSMRDREGRAQQFAVPKGWTGKIPKETSKSADALATRQKMIAGLYPQKATGVTNIEVIPGAGTSHAAAVAKLPMGGRKQITSAMYGPQQDLSGRDIIQAAALGPENTMPSVAVQGAYKNSKGDIETQPGRGLPYEVPLQWTPDPSAPQPPVPGMAPMKPDIDPQVRKDIRGGLAGHVFANAQEAAGSAVLVPKNIAPTQPTPKTPWVEPEKTMKDFVVPLKKEVGARRLGAIAKQYPDYGYASAGPNMRVLGLGNPILERDAQWITKRLKGKSFIPAENIGEYLNTAKEWANKPGSGKVIGALFDEWDQMSPARFNELDQKMRQVTGDILDKYSTAKVFKKTRLREDLMNAYRITAKGGLRALKTAYQNKEFLPAVVSAIALPPLLQQQSDDDDNQ